MRIYGTCTFRYTVHCTVDAHPGVILLGMMPRSLTPRYDAHPGVRLRGMMRTPELDFLKILISRRNGNRFRKCYIPCLSGA